MRGKLVMTAISDMLKRNIPAYAGKTRLCHRVAVARGTSPRMRGKPDVTEQQRNSERNIPAYAGKTTPLLSLSNTGTEHPRVCGENNARIKSISFPCGTSPRMRGKPIMRHMNTGGVRNIPAYAGKTVSANQVRCFWGEHPRVCGKNGWENLKTVAGTGTSPRMRGKLSI